MAKTNAAPTEPDIDELRRIKMMQDMQKELVSWAKSRLAPLSMAVAVLGFFGLKTVIDQNIASLVNSKIDAPVSRQIGKMEDAAEKAKETMGRLNATNDYVNQAAQNALHAADEARKKSNEAAESGKEVQARFATLQPQIDSAKNTVEDIEKRLIKVKADTEAASKNISGLAFSLFIGSRQQTLTGTEFEERIAAFEKKQAGLAAAFAVLVQNDPGQARQAQALLARFREIDGQYRDSIARITKRNAANVILMVGKGEASEKTARLAEKYLQSRGYIASVYYPYGKSKAEKIGDFERDFAGLTIDNGMNGGPVIFINGRLAERDFYGNDLRSVFEEKRIGTPRVVSAAFTPADQYLRRTEDERFDPSNVIVCYFPLSDGAG
jgi:chemotaxis regulatin CheY-phosphate phosphatase CheZ